jgi:hypothetical protein
MDDPPTLRVLGGQADAEDEQLHPEVAEFVRWFTSWCSTSVTTTASDLTAPST